MKQFFVSSLIKLTLLWRMLSPILFWIVVIGVIVGRFMIPGHKLSLAGTYEAFVHIWVGIMFATMYYDYKSKYMYVLVGATLLELVMAILFLKNNP